MHFYFRMAHTEPDLAHLNAEEASMALGTVKWFNAVKGFGFIQPEDGGTDVFVHVSTVESAGMRSLNEGQRINYELQLDRGRSSAINLQID